MRDDFFNSITTYAASSMDADTANYIDKYWISRSNFDAAWADVIRSVFLVQPDGSMSVASTQNVEFGLGGLIFGEAEYMDFSRNAMTSGAKIFAVVERADDSSSVVPSHYEFLRFSFPVDIGWREMSSSSLMAIDIFGRPIRRFFVVSDNGRVGKYSDNDAEVPFEISFHE